MQNIQTVASQARSVYQYIVYFLYWPDDGCFTAETCSPDVIDISSMR